MVSYLQFYSRKDVQRKILDASKYREVSFKFGEKGFGKRPDILQFENDILELAKQGVTSFHISEERWSDPLELSTGMSRKELNDLRIGWDLILDIDGPLEFSKMTSSLVIEALRFYDIDNLTVKFSGNKGFHIAVPFEFFPDEVKGQKIKDWFPEGPRKIASYLNKIIKDKLSAKMFSTYSIQEILNISGKQESEVLDENGLFNPFSVVDIDTILISSRHMFRAPFSFNEKSGLVSIPIHPDDVMKFEKEWAKPENVRFDIDFLSTDKISDASKLILQAFDMEDEEIIKIKRNEILQKEISPGEIKSYIGGELGSREFVIPSEPINADCFPPCILKIMSGIPEDGRKRALFILINFLKGCGWNIEKIKDFVLNVWNKNNYEPLKDGYIISQLSWHQRQSKNILPPNCTNKAYYQDMRFCSKDSFCSKFKNPVNYAIVKSKLMNKQKKKTKKS